MPSLVPYRSSGILLHVTSLPGPHGIGDMGPAAYEFVDFLARSGQTWWQMLPLGPTGYGDSPYQSLSAFGGSPNLISLTLLEREGLLTAADLPAANFPEASVDYTAVTAYKQQATQRAWERFRGGSLGELRARFDEFCHQEAVWLEPFAMFLAIKNQSGGIAWHEWPVELRLRDTNALMKAAVELKPQIDFHKFRQFLFFTQWRALRQYAHERGVRFIGDLPIFVADDSAEVWSRPELFQLDAAGKPAVVAGVPPDYFSPTGQRWGNPVYAWDQHKESGFAWWIARVKSTLQLVDLVRLDHFRGFESYWGIPADRPTAEVGAWLPSPGKALFDALIHELGSLPVIAEDLGVITPEVDLLRRQFNLPGMKILQFAFGGAREDRFLPHNHERETVVYTGTHDNDTSAGWFEGLPVNAQRFVHRYLGEVEPEVSWRLIRAAWASVADLALAPLQDLLALGTDARMNYPGRPTGNWGWRFTREQITPQLTERLFDLTEVYERLPRPK